jgi:mRNA-degrading endonuclease RelE of RelBE toxin-antitoxin system
LEFIEARPFAAHVYDYLSEEEYVELQLHLIDQPAAGDVVPHTGGVRKLRRRGKGRGKRGGLRVIYYWQTAAGEIWLLIIYAKSEKANVPAQVLRKLRERFERGEI